MLYFIWKLCSLFSMRLRWEHWEIMIIGSTLKAANQSTLMNERRLKSSFTFNQVVKLLPLSLLLPLRVPFLYLVLFCFAVYCVLCFIFLPFFSNWMLEFVFSFIGVFLARDLPFTHNAHTPNNANVSSSLFINNQKIKYWQNISLVSPNGPITNAKRYTMFQLFDKNVANFFLSIFF